MALGIPTGGQSKPFAKYDARSGRFSKSDGREQVDITQGFAAIFDLENIEVGWAMFANNTAPDFVMVRAGQPFPARPSDKHRGAFRVQIKLSSALGGDVREFASAAGCVNAAMDELHNAYIAAPESKKGLLPIVTMNGSTAVKTQTPQGTTTNYKPNLSIVKWVPRPAELDGDDEGEAPAPARAPAPAPRAAVPADVEF